MKKIILSLMMVSVIFITGCTPVEESGDYKEGTYFGSVVDNYGGTSNVATAVVYVNENGFIKSVFIDTTYDKDKVNTTKKVLGKDYNMVVASPIKKEWFEQVNSFEKEVINKQGLSWVKWSDDEKTTTDSVSGVTMKVNAIYKAVDEALKQAK